MEAKELQKELEKAEIEIEEMAMQLADMLGAALFFAGAKKEDIPKAIDLYLKSIDEVFEDEDGILIYAPFGSFGTIQKELENRNLDILSSGFERIPQITKKLTEAEMADVEKLIEKLEEDDDVMNVYHTMEE